MKTKTAPWDYNRAPKRIDSSAQTLLAVAPMMDELRELIGSAAFRTWWQQNGSWDIDEATAALTHDLERFECSCTPVHDPCRGCQLRYSYRHNSTVLS